jgi:hypothetical protein
MIGRGWDGAPRGATPPPRRAHMKQGGFWGGRSARGRPTMITCSHADAALVSTSSPGCTGQTTRTLCLCTVLGHLMHT